MNEISEIKSTTSSLIAHMKPISADSHITEPPNCYIDRIDPAFRERAPRIIKGQDNSGDTYFVDQMPGSVPLGMISAAGIDPRKMRPEGVRFEDMHRGGWNAKDRIPDQDRDGVAAEIIYPSVGMVLCNHPDIDYKNACFRAYNGWLAEEFLPGAPGRVFGLGQTAARNPAEMVDDFQRIKEAGLVGVMMPGVPGEADYDSPIYDPVWRAAVELGLPLSFHVLTSRSDATEGLLSGRSRGPKINSFQAIIRACQDIIGMFVYSGVFERHPELKLVTAEADAGWLPHYTYRMNHAFERHRHWLDGGTTLSKMPSEYVKENVFLTFQDDWVAFQLAEHFDPHQLMWASDYPHSDSTWPNSQQLLARHGSTMGIENLKRIVHDNVAELYQLDV